MVKLLSITQSYMNVLQTAAGKCRAKECGEKAINSIIKSGHLSVLEHCMASFEIRCSTRVLGQITRHRHLSFTVQSTRATTSMGEIIIPDEVQKNEKLVDVFDIINNTVQTAYKKLLETGISKESVAYLLPQASLTKMVVSGNFRAWYEYLGKRECARAMPEHRGLATKIHYILRTEAPEIFNRELRNCRHCTEVERCVFH